MTEGKSQLLDLQLLEFTLVHGHEAVRCQHAALVSGGWRDEEVERLEDDLSSMMTLALVTFTCAERLGDDLSIVALLAFTCAASSILNEATVNDTTTGWVIQLARYLVFKEEALVDALVHYD